MRHNKSYRKLGRDSAHRMSMLNNLSKSIIESGKIDTTLHTAKELKSYVEKLVTLGRTDSVHNRRLAFAKLRSRDLVKKLFNEVSPKYLERMGGYTRLVKTGTRKGDGAKTARLEFI